MGDTAGMGRGEALELRYGRRLERCAHRLAQYAAMCHEPGAERRELSMCGRGRGVQRIDLGGEAE